MAVRQIITYENPRLRKTSVKVKRFDPELQRLIDDMIDTMRAAEGIGLAAPQVGVLLRVVVAEYTDGETEELHQTVLVNPEITAREGEWQAEEGCLSIPGYVGTVTRAERIAVRGKNRAGKDVRFTADGALGHILQHEIDHLDGILYIDRIENPDDLRRTEPGRRRRRPGAAEEPAEGSGGQPEAETAERAAAGSPTVDGQDSDVHSGPAARAPAGGGAAGRSGAATISFDEPCCSICGRW